MAKRSRLEEAEARPPKRLRVCSVDRFSALSDELVLRCLSFLPVSDLALCQRLSRKFHTLAGDLQLWKSAYYNRFVRPRAARIPGIRDTAASAASLFYSSKIARWLEDERLVKGGRETDWKKQYKLRHNWARGSCDVREIQIAERASHPPILVRLHEDTAVTADAFGGLRAWSVNGSQRLLASLAFDHAVAGDGEAPTSLAIDVTKGNPDILSVCVGFSTGRFGIYFLYKKARTFDCLYMHATSSNGSISAVAYASPYMITMTEAQLLSLYCFPEEHCSDTRPSPQPPRLLSSLKSHTAWPPLTISIRTSPNNIIVSIAYALPTYLSGWSVGLQELRLTPEGTVLHSRLTSSTTQGFTALSPSSPGTSSPASDNDSALQRTLNARVAPSMAKPTSLSYSHPYLLASNPDNTLTLYLVHSTDAGLSISTGSRLWGHTSSVSGAQVGDRGKAVSVSAHGEEIRVWDLEGGVQSASSRKRVAAGEASVQVRSEKRGAIDGGIETHAQANRGTRSIEEIGDDMEEISTTRGWVGFDHEKVIVLREKGRGTQALVVYDFS